MMDALSMKIHLQKSLTHVVDQPCFIILLIHSRSNVCLHVI
jgi:hypothetical protein